MSWRKGELDSAGEILLAEEVRGFLEELSALSGFPLSLFDGRGRFLYAFSGNGSAGTGRSARRPASGAARRSRKAGLQAPSARSRSCPGGGSPVIQEVRLQEERVAEIRAVLQDSADPSVLRRCLGIAAEWIAGRIRAQCDLDSLSGEILNKYEELALLYELGEELGSVFDTREICRIVLNKALGVIGARKASLLLLDPSGRTLRVAACAGSIPAGAAAAEVLLDASKGVWGHVVRTGKPLIVEDLADLPEALSPKDEPEGAELFLPVPLLLSPLKVKEKVLGILGLADKPGSSAYQAGELKLLAAISAQAALAIHNSLLVRELQENERIRKEMEIAGEIQENLLPRRSPRLEGVDLAGRCVSAKRLGGDAYDFFEMPDGKLGVVVADVSGHSVGSAILMSFVRGVLRSEALRTGSPARLLEAVNGLLYEDLCASEQFLTMSYFTYDARDGLLTYSCAGHPPAVFLRAGRGSEPALIEAEGMAIGLVPAVEFQEKQIRFHPGDVLALYTDGVLDARDARGEPFGLDRFVSALRKALGRGSAEILETAFDAMRIHLAGPDPRARQQDDATVVIFQVKKIS